MLCSKEPLEGSSWKTEFIPLIVTVTCILHNIYRNLDQEEEVCDIEELEEQRIMHITNQEQFGKYNSCTEPK